MVSRLLRNFSASPQFLPSSGFEDFFLPKPIFGRPTFGTPESVKSVSGEFIGVFVFAYAEISISGDGSGITWAYVISRLRQPLRQDSNH